MNDEPIALDALRRAIRKTVSAYDLPDFTALWIALGAVERCGKALDWKSFSKAALWIC